MTEIKYRGCLHGTFFRFDVKADIDNFKDGYVDIEVDKRNGRISIHGVEHGGSAKVVVDLKKLFDENYDDVLEQIRNR